MVIMILSINIFKNIKNMPFVILFIYIFTIIVNLIFSGKFFLGFINCHVNNMYGFIQICVNFPDGRSKG